MLSDEFIAELKEMARVIAPEVTERPLYIVDGSNSWSLFGEMDGCRAWATCQSFLVEDGEEIAGDEWRGPGRLIAFNTDSMLKAVGEEHFNDYARAVFIHELAHTLPYKLEWTIGTQRKIVAAHESGAITPVERPVGYATGEDPYHDVAWARRCAHLWARAKAFGYDINPRGVMSHEAEDQLLLETVVLHCVGEFVTMGQANFRQLALAPIPKSLQDEWQQNVDRVKAWEEKSCRRRQSRNN